MSLIRSMIVVIKESLEYGKTPKEKRTNESKKLVVIFNFRRMNES